MLNFMKIRDKYLSIAKISLLIWVSICNNTSSENENSSRTIILNMDGCDYKGYNESLAFQKVITCFINA